MSIPGDPSPQAASRRPAQLAQPAPATAMSGRYAVGQLLAVAVVLLIALPVLPVILLVMIGIRVRDRVRARAGGDAAEPGSAPPPSAVHAAS
jgi:hypothetical protein